MNQKERFIIIATLTLIIFLIGLDLFNDSRDSFLNWHVIVEAAIALVALFGVVYILRDSFKIKQRLKKETIEFSKFKKEAELWKLQSKKYIDGLSIAIDQQLNTWKLSASEKEVAFLLLKGLSLKEIAEIRQTVEKTARVQSMAIYSKSGLAGRSELSAFFLEDLLAPSNDKFIILDSKINTKT